MTNDQERLREILHLSPLAENPISFAQFLAELSEHRERADSSAAVIFRAIMAMGVEEPDDEHDPERRQYLKMLKDLRIPSLVAFRHVVGTQRFALQPLSFLLSAASGGAQLRKMIVIDGGPGSGKDFFKDGIFAALERHTDESEKVYAVIGCPEHESPINLLKLLKPAQIAQLADELGVADLSKIVDMALSPCQRCYEQVMGTIAEPKAEPSFDGIKIVPMRLSVMSAGIADWQPGGEVTLAAALRKANRGFVSLPDAFVPREARAGESDERLLLLDATQGRRLPGALDAAGEVMAPSPLDVVILATTNRKALEAFLHGDDERGVRAVVPDADAFTSRTNQMRLPYNTVTVEEVRAYRQELARFQVTTGLDPLALKVVATVAVLSRLAKPRKRGAFVHPLDVMALYRGENIEVMTRSVSDFDRVWATSSSPASSTSSSTPPRRFGSTGPSPANSAAKPDDDLPAVPEGMPVTAGLLFQFADPKEGMNGLDMRTMLGLISSINQMGLRKPGAVKCVNSLEILSLLRAFIAGKTKMADNSTPEQKEVYERLLKWLGGIPIPGAPPADPPELVESEYRRMLRALLLQVFAPDYADRAAKLFSDYRLHAPAASQGQPAVREPSVGLVPVNIQLIDELDRFRVGKPKGAPLTDEDRVFRGQLNAIIGALRDEFMEEHGREAASDFQLTWETIPELAKAIRGKLDSEIGLVMEKLITTDVESDLSDFEQEQLDRANQALTELGFCKECIKPVLDYARQTKVWSFELK